MTEYLRVKVDGPDHEISITTEQYDAQPDAFKVLDKPAVGPDGEQLAPKYKTSPSQEAEKKKATSRATTEAAKPAAEEGNI